MNKKKTIGVLGGMGPGASANLYQEIIRYSQTKYNAVQDFDFPPVIIYSLPLVDFDETGITNERKVKEQLIYGVKTLEKAGCDLIIIGCNTVHIFYDDMQNAVNIPIFNIVEETKKEVLNQGYSKVGLFASESTTRTNLYQKRFSSNDIEVISPNKEQQLELNKVIEHVMGGSQGIEDILVLKNIARNYVKQGAEAIVLGCTEIPLAINQTHTDVKLFNTIDIIVRSAVDFSMGKKKIT